MKSKIVISSLSFLILISIFLNIKPDNSKTWFISFSDANTKETYNTYHDISHAHELATGKGVKVGIIGKYFGFNTNRDLYAGGKNFTGNRESFEEIAEHGLWMATTLREIAPDVEIYALNARDKDRDNETNAIVNAINWAIENDIDILSYSAEPFDHGAREVIDKAVHKAIENKIVTTFIHYDLDENILPYGFFPGSPGIYAREADVNILHYDYNLLLLYKYENYLKGGRIIRNNGDDPYFSNSSMSPVLAGIIAMMKEINNDLKVEEYKKILIETSKTIDYKGKKIDHVVDAYAAINSLTGYIDTNE